MAQGPLSTAIQSGNLLKVVNGTSILRYLIVNLAVACWPRLQINFRLVEVAIFF